MAKPLEERVRLALTELLSEDAEIHLEEVGGGRVQGVVRSHRFATMSGSERQANIWKYLDSHLSPLECTRVVFIATETPEEYAALEAETG